MSNLPDWPGAESVYSRVSVKLREMATKGHVKMTLLRGQPHCTTSAEIDSVIEALNRGDEEALKAFLLNDTIPKPFQKR